MGTGEREPGRSGEPWAPNWLVGLLGVDYFGDVRTTAHDGQLSEGLMARVWESAKSRNAPSFSRAVRSRTLNSGT